MEAHQKLYSTHAYLQSRFDQVGKKLAFSAEDVQSWEAWRDETRSKIKELNGYNTMIKAPLEPQITSEEDCGDHIRQHVIIQTEPGVQMTLFVLIPKKAQAAYPAMLALHGHSSGGKYSVAGISEIPEIAKAIDEYNYSYGLELVREGYITFCPDARGFGERAESFGKVTIMSKSCSVLNNMAIPLGQTVNGMWTWDLHRLVDYVETRSDCLPGKIGCLGLSGGGLQTLFATALDDRIQFAVISGYMYGYKESLLDLPNNCHCNYVPHLYENVDMGDIAALIAPRPLFIETGSDDPLNGASGVANVNSQVAIAKKAYDLLDTTDNLAHFVYEGGHRWFGIDAIPWVNKQFA